jgi:hypothetical protein
LGAVSKGIGSVGNAAKGASQTVGGVGNAIKKGLIGSEEPLGGALGAVSKGIGSVGNAAKNAGNVAKSAVSGTSKAIGGAGNLAKQGLTGQKKPMGGLLGGISKGLGSIGNALTGKNKNANENEETLDESKTISNFLRAITSKNYHQANVHLKEIIENKLNKKILNSIR